MGIHLKYKKLIFIFLAVIICFVFTFIKDAKATLSNLELRGMLKGNTWALKSAVLRKKINSRNPILILELSDIVSSEMDVCKEKPQDLNQVTIEIPFQAKGGFLNVMPDYENAMIHLASDTQNLACYYSLKLKTDELNGSGLAYVSGDLQLSSTKTDTELVGSFKARVCN